MVLENYNEKIASQAIFEVSLCWSQLYTDQKSFLFQPQLFDSVFK